MRRPTHSAGPTNPASPTTPAGPTHSAGPTTPAGPGRFTRATLAAVALDSFAVVLFVVIGRASHHHGETLHGFASTSWPFAVGLALGEVLAARLPSCSPAAPGAGALVTVSAVAVGMGLRVVAGQGTAAAFIVVALLCLGAVMVGARWAVGALARRAAPSP